ncbi:MAG: transposase [Thiotrichaceae bacterium]
MKKRSYHSKNVKLINWEGLSQQNNTGDYVFSIDIAKEKQYGQIMDSDRQVLLQVNWLHPQETPRLLEGLRLFKDRLKGIVMEPSGVYGDTLRYQFNQEGYTVYKISPKRVKDASEVYDGVPSSHDAKAAYLIARLYWENTGSVWQPETEGQRKLDALTHHYHQHQRQHEKLRNQVEAKVHRHWPELTSNFTSDSITLEALLVDYGDPAVFTQNTETALEAIHKASRGKVKSEKSEPFIQASSHSIGIPCLEQERHYLQALGAELRHHRLKLKGIRQELEQLLKSDPKHATLLAVTGIIATAFMLANNLDPSQYPSAGSYLKAMGLNLKERSSGTHQGQLKISKRGSGTVRLYLYFAVLRIIQHDSHLKQWYDKKVKRDGSKSKLNALIGVMRKMVKGIWAASHHGEVFDSSKLVKLSLK